MLNFLNYRQLYYSIKDKRLESKIIDDQLEDLKETLHIPDLSKSYLHTLVWLEDCANWDELLRSTSYLNDLLADCRHIQCSFFMAVQHWKFTNTNVKENINTIFLFDGFSRQRIYFIISQTIVRLDLDDFMELYQSLNQFEYLWINCEDGNIQKIRG
jgi:hypothetical protein